MTPAESVGLPETCEHSIPVTQGGLRAGGNMTLAQWCSQQGGTHSDKDVGGDRFGKITATLGLSTWVAVLFAIITILETKIERLSWRDDAGREERHR